MSVTLHPNGEYWSARWRDTAGRQRNKCLGRMDKVSERSAQALCRRIEADIMYGKAGAATSITLEAYCKQFLDGHPEYAPGTRYLHNRTHRYLIAHFGARRKISDIAKPMAREFRSKLAAGEIALTDKNGERTNEGAPAESSVCQIIRDAKQLFGQAEDDDLIQFNPFAKLKSTAPEPDKNWHYVTMDELDKLLAACRNNGWKCLLALCRLGGLRQSEALRLKWSEVDLTSDNPRLTVQNPGRHRTTKKRTRTTPIEKKLLEILSNALMDGNGAEKVCQGVSPNCMCQRFQSLCRRAGVQPWPDWCKTLRKNLESDWAAYLPQWQVDSALGNHDGDGEDLKQVTDALGNSPEVAKKHYLRVEDRWYASITSIDRRKKPEEPKKEPERKEQVE